MALMPFFIFFNQMFRTELKALSLTGVDKERKKENILKFL